MAASTLFPSPPSVTDHDLVARVLAGDPAAERALYDAHVDRVFRLAFRMTGDEEVAQDVTQECFIKAFAQLATFRGDSALATWLHSITVSIALNTLRRVKRTAERERPMAEAPEATAGGRRSEPDLRARLHEAIAALPTGYRTVFVLHDVEGYTHEEIAAALGIESGTSKAQLSRARGKLRQALQAFRDHLPGAAPALGIPAPSRGALS